MCPHCQQRKCAVARDGASYCRNTGKRMAVQVIEPLQDTAPDTLHLRPSPFPAWMWQLHHENGRVFKRFKTDSQLSRWLASNGYVSAINPQLPPQPFHPLTHGTPS